MSVASTYGGMAAVSALQSVGAAGLTLKTAGVLSAVGGLVGEVVTGSDCD